MIVGAIRRGVRFFARAVKRAMRAVWYVRSRLPVVDDGVRRGVSVVIATFKPVPWLGEAVNSVLVQKSKTCDIEVLLCVNGSDREYYEALKRKYAGTGEVRVLYTERVGANAGRNLGVAAASEDFLYFLDSDDLLTPHYFRSLLRYFQDPEVNIVAGRLVYQDEWSAIRTPSAVIDGEMLKLGMGATRDYLAAAAFISSFCMKLYRTDFVRNRLARFDEDAPHTEDTLFWARHFDQLAGKIFISNPYSREAYVCRVTANSLSRPPEERQYSFWITDSIWFLKELQKVLASPDCTKAHRDFVLSKMSYRCYAMHRYFMQLDEEKKNLARREILRCDIACLDKSRFFDEIRRGVSVVIPTCKPVPWLEAAVRSVLAQKSDMCDVEVLLGVNGPDRNWYECLRKRYEGVADVRVLRTERTGSNAGRNIGVDAASKEFLFFMDDDDLLTAGYLRSLLRHFVDPEVNIVVGRLVDQNGSDGERNADTYVNRAMCEFGQGRLPDCARAESFLVSFCAKVYRTAFVRDKLGKFEEDAQHSEDVLFWARHFDRLEGGIYVSDPMSPEAYVRRVTPDSLSRPSEDRRYRFWVTDRLWILDELKKVLARDGIADSHRTFVLSIIRSQTYLMEKYLEKLDGELRQKAQEEILAAGNPYVTERFVDLWRKA